MPRFSVTPEKEAQLLARMAACGLHEADLGERFVPSRGPGGQKVNRSATCVQLDHRPSGLSVKMQRARSQALNRFYARRRMCELIEARLFGRDSPEVRAQEKLRKQKTRRRRRSSQGRSG